ncbi:MAG: N(4)-(beta-N-acetylglucosaminyl)-L-asparaginase [Saprospiraceae bacterium]
MLNRRKFIHRSALSSLLAAIGLGSTACASEEKATPTTTNVITKPTVIATWERRTANQTAWNVIKNGGRALDAVEAGVRVLEADENDQSVGYGGRPDREGKVTLDACIMDEKGDCGSVCFLQGIKHPISVARKVMEETPHVILAGEGALKFALAQGFKVENLLTEKSKKEYEAWLVNTEYKPVINIENHDTIGMVTIDQAGNISGACTTSGMAYKMHGRVGDSPIIGAGLFVDNEVGGAAATGVGEAVLKTLGSFLVVELMRQGKTPQEACEEAVNRIAKNQHYKDIQVGYCAVNKAGEYGGYSVQPGFSYVVNQADETQLFQATSFIK